MYTGKIAPPTVKVKGKTYYLEGEHSKRSDATSLASLLRRSYNMSALVRKKRSVYAVYAR